VLNMSQSFFYHWFLLEQKFILHYVLNKLLFIYINCFYNSFRNANYTVTVVLYFLHYILKVRMDKSD
jgi:hypothetical protein